MQEIHLDRMATLSNWYLDALDATFWKNLLDHHHDPKKPVPERPNQNANLTIKEIPGVIKPVQDKNLLRDQMYPLRDDVHNQGRTPPLHVDEITERLILITSGITFMIL